MHTAYVIVSILAAAWVGYSAVAVFFRAKWTDQFLTDYGVPQSWRPWLGLTKAAGAVGLVVGLFVPPIAVLAGIGLVVYFTGAVVTVTRARYYSHIPYPLAYVAPVLAAMALKFAA